MPRVTVIARRRKGNTMATPLARRPEPGDGSPQAAVTISAVTEYLLPATMRGVAVQAMPTHARLTGLQFASALLGVWVIISPFILDARFWSAAPTYWSNIVCGGVLVVLPLAGLASVRR